MRKNSTEERLLLLWAPRARLPSRERAKQRETTSLSLPRIFDCCYLLLVTCYSPDISTLKFSTFRGNLIKTKICSLFTWIISITISNTGISGVTTVLYPAKINITVGVASDAGVSCVEIFIYVWIEDRVEINKGFITGWSDGSKDALVLEPLHQLGRPHRVVDYAFNVVRYQDLPQVPHLQQGSRG